MIFKSVINTFFKVVYFLFYSNNYIYTLKILNYLNLTVKLYYIKLYKEGLGNDNI